MYVISEPQCLLRSGGPRNLIIPPWATIVGPPIFVAKVIEKAAASQLVEHLTTNELYYPMQSAYQMNFSTETDLLKFQNDTLYHFDRRNAVFLVLLDLSAAFDTVDHKIIDKTA